MKAALTITSRGVITLPTKLRAAMGIQADDQLIAEVTPQGLLLRPAVTLPVELYSPAREREFDAAEAALAEAMTLRKLMPAAPSAAGGKKAARARKASA
jgi:bifunctional DNA-binding transcriptional regulator/antitoxin component of YhaV-PrlF toxin-antitoxin module